MVTQLRTCLLVGLLGLLVACGGGGGGNRAAGVDEGPPPPGGAVPPPPEVPTPSPSPYAEAEELRAFISAVTLNENDQAVADFQLTDGDGVAITDLTGGDIRFVISKLQGSPLGNLTGTWQSYVNQIEEAGSAGPGTESRLQATYERNEDGFTNNGDGTYRYQFATSLTDLDQDILDQAATEGLDLSYESNRTHRVAIQFDNAPGKANPHYDWVPQSGATSGVFSMDIAATENCNRCHDPLAIHGGGRIEVEYCVTCHNAGSTDANSTNTVDMKVMIHKIHMGRNLPSVQEGGEYAIWGFNDSKHDYSNVAYPQDIRNCVNCHVGTGTVGDRTDLVVTAQGDNWAQVPTRAACGSCHENVNFDRHAGGQPDDSACASCHSVGGRAGSVEESHLIPIQEARKLFDAQILGVDNSQPGQQPVVSFKVSNPQTGQDYDIMTDPEFTGAGARLAVGMAWSTSDYTNTGNGTDNASQVQADALADATSNGDGSFSVTMPLAIPDGSVAPNIAASGSGVATVEGHPVVEIEGELAEVPVGDAAHFFSIDEADGSPVARRQSVTIDNCLTCHGALVLHGGNRADNIDSCVSCHNPRNTDRGVRDVAANPPTDGKQEESIDFKTMVHGIHASAMRENPLQIVGFRGFTTYVYDEDHVQYPGDLSNCVACHTEDGYKLPLASSVLGTSVDTGGDLQDPTDDMVTTPATAVCASCHDDDLARSHMESNGGNFSTTQSAIDDGEVIEECSVCHGSGRNADVAEVHGVE